MSKNTPIKKQREYIANHACYVDKRPYFARCIKVYQVISKKWASEALDVVLTENYWDEYAQPHLEDFKSEYHVDVYGAGRSGGYLILDVPYVDPLDVPELGDDKVRDLYWVLHAFDKMVDNIIEQTEWLARHARVREEEYTVTKKRKVVVVGE